MSDYNFYAKHLDEAFRKARTAYTDAFNRAEKARKDYEAAQTWRRESRDGENEERRRSAELEYLKARDEFRKVQREAWAQYDREAQEITGKFKKTLAEDNTADSDKLDVAALDLLKSGIMNAADYEKMAEKFDGNATMTRMLSKYVREYADQIKDNTERSRMYQLADKTAHGQSRKEREWETLTNAARTYSGRRASDSPEPAFVVAMAKKWDDEPAQEAISNF